MTAPTHVLYGGRCVPIDHLPQLIHPSVTVRNPARTIECAHHDGGDIRYGDLVLIYGGGDA